MSYPTRVVIVGAGPYGLSVAAHLRSEGVDFRIFGKPMFTWREQMPKGMMLKSDGFASNISDPTNEFTIEKFCKQQGIAYDHTRIPVALDTFVSYGGAFQKRMVPELDERMVTSLEEAPYGFKLQLEDGETVSASHVVLAVGISHFSYVPEVIRNLGPEYVSHSSQHNDPAKMRGKKVAVVGSGASALDLAGLLRDADVDVEVVARRSAVRFHNPPDPRPKPLWKKLRTPHTGIGPGWKSRFFTDTPGLFHQLPQDFRVDIVKRYLGPSAGWTVRKQIEGRVPVHTGMTPRKAEVRDGKAHLYTTDKDGATHEFVADHLIAATGYRVDISRLKFLNPGLASKLTSVENAPILSLNFESSVPGLYFVGVAAAFSFGPVMRFAFGARYTAFRVARALAKTSAEHPVPEQVEAPINS